ncbi:MAG: CoA-binding protein [Candidatus Micrarchaeaceae archaeon]
MDKYMYFDYMLNSKSVAIIGASSNPEKIGYIIMKNFVSSGFNGELYPVNIKEEGEILGYKAYKSVLDIKKDIDLAVIAIPAQVVPSVLEECGKANVKSVIVISGGFSEVGNIDLQQKLVDISKEYNIPLLGPNCLGVMNQKERINTLFLPTFKMDTPKIGGVSFATQSGAVGSSVLDMIADEGFGLSKFISYGNAADLDECDILNYLGQDKDTKSVLFYLEGVRRGREFMEIATKVAKIKPIIAIKGGATSAGSQAAHSHTASLAGSYEAYVAMFKQTGIIQAKSLDELLDFAKIFEAEPLAKGNRVAIITNGGGTGVLASDAVYANGMIFPELNEESKAKLREAMPAIVNIRMPLDMAGDADEKRFGDALEIISNDSNVDAIIVICLFQTPGADSKVAEMLIRYNSMMKKPMVVVSAGGTYTKIHRSIMENSGVPVYPSPERAARALAMLINYSKFKNAKIEER